MPDTIPPPLQGLQASDWREASRARRQAGRRRRTRVLLVVLTLLLAGAATAAFLIPMLVTG